MDIIDYLILGNAVFWLLLIAGVSVYESRARQKRKELLEQPIPGDEKQRRMRAILVAKDLTPDFVERVEKDEARNSQSYIPDVR